MAFKSRRAGDTAPASPSNDLAFVFDNGRKEVVCAAFSAGLDVNADARDLIHSMRFPLDERSPALVEQLTAWLARLDVKLQPSNIIFAPEDYSERTRSFPLEAEERDASGDALAAIIVEAADTGATDTKGQPFFEAPIDALACDYVRMPNSNDLSITEMTRAALDTTLHQVETELVAPLSDQLSYSYPPESLYAEPRLMAVLRYWRMLGTASSSAPKEDHLTAIFVVSGEGAAIGFWNIKRGLFKGDGENFVFDDVPTAAPTQNNAYLEHTDLSVVLSMEDEGERLSPMERAAAIRQAALVHAIEFAVSKLDKKLTTAKLEEYGVLGVQEVIFAASPDVYSIVEEQLERILPAGLACRALPLPLEEAVAQGLLLGSVDDATVPPINLLTKLRARAQSILQANITVTSAALARGRTWAALAVLIPFIVMLGVVLTSWMDESRIGLNLLQRKTAAEQEAARLRPVSQARQTYVNTFNWMQSYVQQIIDLRNRQGTAIGLYADLDARWPLSEDSTFYTSTVKLGTTGGLEMTGFTKRKDALTALVNSMDSASSVYGNVTYDIQEGSPTTAAAAPPPGISLPTVAGNNLPPGVLKWTIRALYVPLATASAKPAGGGAAAPVPAGGGPPVVNSSGVPAPLVVTPPPPASAGGVK